YLGISLVLQTKDDFRFVIPYVEFAKQIRGNRPTLLDTSVIVDGRVLDIVQTKVMQGLLVVPKFVLNELQAIADSADKLRRARGRRGLEILQKLQECPIVDVSIEETDPAEEGATVDQKLILLAQRLQARIMTNDYNLNKVATLRGVDVINLNDLAKAMRPVVLPGEHLSVKVVKPGEGPAQGVGYLEDGTMVVVEGGRHHLGQEVNLVVTSTLQTSAGRMIFGRYEGHEEPPHDSQPSTSASPHEAAASSEPTPSASPDESETASPASHRPPRGPSGRNPRRIR
ncbi:MAG TPA: PIN domain-containing protein, partial [Phycisphaeraceae bacterium]